jgi:hypothetical protein
MKLFRKNKFVWMEPWFFCQRVRDRGDWIRAVIPAILGCAGISVLLLFVRGGALQWWQIALCGLGLGAVIQLGIEAAYMRRDISIDEDSIEAFGNAGQITSYAKFALKDIIFLEIRRGEDIGKPFAMIVLRTPSSGHIIGVPKSIHLERLAQTLAKLNVPVTLSGWEPAIDPEIENPYFYAVPEGTRLQVANVDSIPEVERNLTQLPEMLVALVMGVWPFFIWMGLAAYGTYYVYQQWQALSIWTIAVAGIAGFASLTIPFGYYASIGDYLSARHLINVARGRVLQRASSLVKSFDEKVFAVELIQRETWGAMAPKVVDFGFLITEPDSRRMLFEGNKERWIVPAGAVSKLKIEEVQFGTAGESANGELRCYVVLTYQKQSEPFEIGMRVADKEPGKNTDSRRMSKAVELFEYLESGLALQPLATQESSEPLRLGERVLS